MTGESIVGSRRAAIVAAATVMLAAAAGCGGGGDSQPPRTPASAPTASPPADSEPSGPVSAKHAQLLQIATQLRESGNLYFGLQPVRALDAMDTTAMSVQELAALDFRKAMAAFQFGDAERAEDLFARSAQREPSSFTRYMLGVTQLRIGEVRNCLENHNAESCVFPIAGGGVHTTPDPAERAMSTLRGVLPETPRRYRPKVKWFATIAAMALGRYPDGLREDERVPPEAYRSAYDIGRFPDVAMPLGVAENDLAGSVIVEDLDNDGLLDIVTSTTALEGQMRAFHNEGDGTFADRTKEAGLLGQVGGLNMIHADYDSDGFRDLLVLRGGWLGTHGRMPNSLLRNRGDGTFEDVTDRAGIGANEYPCQTAAFADYDLDGDLDLFLGNETPPPASGMRWPCELFRNEGDGTFTDVAEEAGVQVFKLVKGVAWGDWDGDRYPDLYVSNQFDTNRFYRNNGDGTFTDIAEETGLDQPENSFSTWFWDYDNDGGLDLFVAGYGGGIDDFVKSYLRDSPGSHRCALFHREGDALVDRGLEAGITYQSLTMGAAWGDLDNDGWPDFYLGTGAPEFDVLLPNLMYRGDGAGGFQDVTEAGGFGNLQKGHGIAFGDLDNDGD
ncbi:MAG TPA: VCBS repeat-containing protein, partial [bacterium]|nr:VCBS repeat-containing protein [bacterium]